MNTRNQHIEKLERELDSITAGLDMYENRLHKESADMQSKLQNDFDSLRRQRDEVRRRVADTQRADDALLEELQADAERAAREFRRSLERARDRLDTNR